MEETTKDPAGIGGLPFNYTAILSLGSESLILGRVGNLTVEGLSGSDTPNCASHVVRFQDGRNERELAGKVSFDEDDSGGKEHLVILDMGDGRVYRFKRCKTQLQDLPGGREPHG